MFTAGNEFTLYLATSLISAGKSRGFGFVEMTTQVEAQKAISMFNEYKMGERALLVNLAKPRVERSASPSRTNRF